MNIATPTRGVDQGSDAKQGNLLLYISVPLRRMDGRLYVETQALNGLKLWADNFASVTVVGLIEENDSTEGYTPVPAGFEAENSIRFVLIRPKWKLLPFLRYRPEVRRIFRAEIEKNDYLSFALGGLIGDWGAVGCLTAYKMGRPFAAWTDRVESEVVRRGIPWAKGKRKLKARLTWWPMAIYERYVLRRATLGLFHGMATFQTYRAYPRHAQIVHDIHLGKADHIGEEQLTAKADAAHEGVLRLLYVGRASSMKGGPDWLAVMAKLKQMGVAYEATWLGSGEDLEELRALSKRNGTEDCVQFPGHTDDRDAVLSAMRNAHLFVFCHQTPESPRNLIEALASGAPIVGYGDDYSRDLVKGHGAGAFVEIGEVSQLADTIAELAANRGKLAEMIRATRCAAQPMTDVAVFRDRSNIIKTYLPGPAQPVGESQEGEVEHGQSHQ